MKPTLPRTVFARNLRHELDERDMTQQQLAFCIGVSNRAVSGWCTGERVPQRVSMGKITFLLGHERPWFFDEHGFELS